MYSGKREGELDGNGWAEIVHPDDLPITVERWTAALESGDDYEAEFRLRRYDGEYRWHLASGVALRDREGTILRWMVPTQTLTTRRMPKGFSSGGWSSGPPSGTAFGRSVRTCWAWPMAEASGSVSTRPGPGFWVGQRGSWSDGP